MEYNFSEIEKRWQNYWKANKTYHVEINESKPKYYVLDMFPYPSGAGLHVGHPLGYIASDIYSRYKRLQGFNVLHPMGYDSFGLPAEQYAIQTGQHPAITTENNIKRYREQLDKIGFSFDWDREVRTCNPKYYKWTQWVFIKMFNHWYNNKTQKAEPIETLIRKFEENGNHLVDAPCSPVPTFYAEVWRGMTEKEKREILMNYRLAYLANTIVNWCPTLGTVLANDEVFEGVSKRGGHPVEQKLMKQWLLRITAYSRRLLDGLDTVNWTESLKEMQRNWIGRSEGAEVYFPVKDSDSKILVFTTRPDTIYGVTFMVLAPESKQVEALTTPEYKQAIEDYINETKRRTERERMMDVKTVSGQFTGSYAVNPFSGDEIPIYISDYVLSGYGTGAIMAVPAHDSRDYAFAKHFDLPITEVITGGDISVEAYEAKDGTLINSELINDLEVKDAIRKIINEIEERDLGSRKINFRLRDAIFSRQRYWGEPFPVYFKDELPYIFNEKDLPLKLPEVDKYLPTEKGEPPLGRAKNWKTTEGYPIELSTMPGFAGSSAYYIRYMDPQNNDELVSKEANNYWRDVDLYIGGTEHATGHLIYSRFWNKFLFDMGIVCEDEPFKKLINQGMIQGSSRFVYRVKPRNYALVTLWDVLKQNLTNCKFKKDYKLSGEIYDFCCEEHKLIIECTTCKNAGSSYKKAIKELRKLGYKLLVISNDEIINNRESVIACIKNAVSGETEIEHDFTDKENNITELFVSFNLLKDEFNTIKLHVDVNLVDDVQLDIEAFKKWRIEYENACFILEDGKYICGQEVEKMSKSYFNVVNPDDIIEQYGADTLRLYEMFLGPLEQAKPWDTQGIEGVNRFLKKIWRLCRNRKGDFELSDAEPVIDELKTLHKTIKKVTEDIERFSFNTAVSAFMICINELSDLKCNKRAIIEKLIVLLSPFAPHITEEIWHLSGHEGSITNAEFPEYNEEYLKETTCKYPVAFNGKRRFEIELSVDLTTKEIEAAALNAEASRKWLVGKMPKKVIVVPKRMINVVI